jgi:hypothetical protein
MLVSKAINRSSRSSGDLQGLDRWVIGMANAVYQKGFLSYRLSTI